MRKSIMFSLACCLAAASWAGCSDETGGGSDGEGGEGEGGSGSGGGGNVGNTSTNTGTGTGTGTGSGTGTGTGSGTGTGTGGAFECFINPEVGCDIADPVACDCVGCGATCVDPADPNVVVSDCTCDVCDADEFCSSANACNSDGACDPFNEGCLCADCAGHPNCQ